MQRQRGEVVPIGEVFGGLDGPVKAIHDKASDKRTVLNFGATPLFGCGGRRITILAQERLRQEKSAA